MICPTCHGAGWVDLGLVCYCGRAATFYVEKFDRWYCGMDACHPEKHPRQNELLARGAAADEEDGDLEDYYHRMFY